MSRSIWFFMDSVPFTRDVIDGSASLGGSESACKGTAEALARRGHDVKIFATNLEHEMVHAGVPWFPADLFPEIQRFAAPDVFVSLRTGLPFLHQVHGRLNVLWCQDLLVPPADTGILPSLSQVDHLAFVSRYHREQWCNLHPFLRPMAWVTRNGIDPTLVPEPLPPKRPNHFIYISRPERGLEPLLALWPQIRERRPDATLAIARYRSMYDGEGSNVKAMCDQFDRLTQRVSESVGGIEMLGALGKAELYQAIAEAQLMLYPGIETFAETNCIAATEAQACGTPLIASYKGAIPETLHPDAGRLIEGDAMSERYQQAFLSAMSDLLSDEVGYRKAQEAGRQHAPRSSFDVIAEEWETWIAERFEERYQTHKMGVLRQLLHWDRHAIAKEVAQEIVREAASETDGREAEEAIAFCDRVIRQEEQTASDYAAHALASTQYEAEHNVRLQQCATDLKALAPKRVLDVACGNGAFALLMAEACPDAQIDGYDYSEGVLTIAREGLTHHQQVTFRQSAFEDIPTGDPYDVVFCGEFLEHVEKPWELLDRLEQYAGPEGTVMLTTPCGPFAELLPEGMPLQRGHVHSFSVRDICDMCQDKREFRWRYLASGDSPHGNPCGYWLLSYKSGGGPARQMDYRREAVTTRPYQRLVVSMIVKNEADWLRRCLRSLYGVVDRIVVYDTGSVDGSQAIAAQHGAEVIEGEWPNHFGEARNRALRAVEQDAEWILWIDADEVLENKGVLRRFITGAGPFQAYAIHQVHVSPDVPTYDDKPCRLFRTGAGIQFYGHVHEQPETAKDAGIHPSLDLSDPNAPRIIHFGYQNETTRRGKLTQRNLQLLRDELKSGEPRELAYVLAMRDYCNFALFHIERNGMTAYARNAYAKAVKIYHDRFDDPAHKYHDLAFPYYQSALEALGCGVVGKWAFAAGPQHVMNGGSPTVEVIRAESAEELARVTTVKIQQWCQPLIVKPVDCTPVETEAIPT